MEQFLANEEQRSRSDMAHMCSNGDIICVETQAHSRIAAYNRHNKSQSVQRFSVELREIENSAKNTGISPK